MSTAIERQKDNRNCQYDKPSRQLIILALTLHEEHPRARRRMTARHLDQLLRGTLGARHFFFARYATASVLAGYFPSWPTGRSIRPFNKKKREKKNSLFSIHQVNHNLSKFILNWRIPLDCPSVLNLKNES